MSRRPVRAALVLGLALVIGLAAPAAAHVSVSSPDAAPGGFAKLVFRVPNEEDAASTIRLEVSVPADAGIQSLRVKPVPGWTHELQREGDTVIGVIWSGGAIRPGEFQEFEVSGGPLPESDELVFPAVQTYDDGTVVRWVEPTPADGTEPEHPAPVLSLSGESSGDSHGNDGGDGTETAAPATPSADVSQDDVDDARMLATVAIVVGALGLLAAVAAFLTRRRA